MRLRLQIRPFEFNHDSEDGITAFSLLEFNWRALFAIWYDRSMKTVSLDIFYRRFDYDFS